MIVAVLVIASPLQHIPLYISPSYGTYNRELYLQGPRLNPGFSIVAIHATISALPDVHVQIWLEIEGQGNLFHINSGSLGTANSDLSGLYIVVNPNTPVILFWWADNLGTSQRDFHASITIFYQTQ
jgi:hypothetical protein